MERESGWGAAAGPWPREATCACHRLAERLLRPGRSTQTLSRAPAACGAGALVSPVLMMGGSSERPSLWGCRAGRGGACRVLAAGCPQGAALWLSPGPWALSLFSAWGQLAVSV